jgi:hypothetical protein
MRRRARVGEGDEMTHAQKVRPLRSASALLVAVGVLSAGCDTYSRDDILFRRGVPSAKDLALEPPGAKSDDEAAEGDASASVARQALEACLDDSLRCTSQNIATMLNGLTRGLITIIDLVRLLPPTRRETGRRVWGPHFSEREDRTHRFEMVKNLDANGDFNGTLTLCLHVAVGKVEWRLRDPVDCTVTEDAESGLTRVLIGVITPGEEDGNSARTGSGTLVLDANRMAAISGDRSLLGVFDIQYDNTSDPKTIAMTITDVEDADENPIPDNAAYAFVGYDDGSGRFDFVLKSDLHRPNPFADSLLERLDIRARWQADGAGRAEAQATGGDVGANVWSVTECWDGGLSTTWRRNDDPGVTPIGDDEALDCVLPAFE